MSVLDRLLRELSDNVDNLAKKVEEENEAKKHFVRAGVHINGTFEKWMLSICAGLFIAGLVAGVSVAVTVGGMSRDVTWIKEAVSDIKGSVRDNDRRINLLERDRAD